MERRFCCAKSVACGRVIEREWGNPQRFPPHTPPSLRYARVRTTKPEGNHKKKNHPLGGFSFWNVAGRFELAASTCAQRVKSRGPAGLLRMALPFVGCREASSSLVFFTAQSAKNKETPSDRMAFLFGMPRAGWNSLPRPARSASNRSVGDGVPDVPSARRCRAGNGFPRRFAPRSKCPWGTPRNDRGGVYRHAANIRQDGVSFLTAPGETPASGRAAPPAPRRSAPAVRPGRR